MVIIREDKGDQRNRDRNGFPKFPHGVRARIIRRIQVSFQVLGSTADCVYSRGESLAPSF